MNTEKILTLSIFLLISYCLIVGLIALLTRKWEKSTERLASPSFGIWACLQVVSYSFLISTTVRVLSEALEVIEKVKQQVIREFINESALFMGIGLLWYSGAYIVSQTIGSLLLQRRNGQLELENENIAYFIFKGGILLGFVISSLSLYEMLLRSFVPEVNTPFYH